MAYSSSIEWTESTWNPVTGCSKISPGCDNCYAERMALRLKAMGQPNYINGFKLATHEHLLRQPLKWKRPQMIFVNSMSDLFHQKVSIDFILKVFKIMEQAKQHKFQILTKRSSHLLELDETLFWPKNVWMGVSIESADYVFRLNDLRKTGAAIKFVSFEPLLGPIPNLDLSKIDWVIVGGESGPKARPMSPTWVRDIREQCKKTDTPFFFKQWGGINKKKAGRIFEGRTWDDMPRLDAFGH